MQETKGKIGQTKKGKQFLEVHTKGKGHKGKDKDNISVIYRNGDRTVRKCYRGWIGQERMKSVNTSSLYTDGETQKSRKAGEWDVDFIDH